LLNVRTLRASKPAPFLSARPSFQSLRWLRLIMIQKRALLSAPNEQQRRP
jgi:hypothetical protein